MSRTIQPAEIGWVIAGLRVLQNVIEIAPNGAVDHRRRDGRQPRGGCSGRSPARATPANSPSATAARIATSIGCRCR